PATAAAPASTTSAAPAPHDDAADVVSTVRAWAAAWSRKDVAAYTAFYVGDFTGKATSRQAWETSRAARIEAASHLRVEVSKLQATVDGDTARVRFRQRYRSKSLQSSESKTLELTRMPGGQWLIRQESTDR
ncbi:MAG: DUF4440 domain-containing protein, partial [Burkholderiaceae bacterium]